MSSTYAYPFGIPTNLPVTDIVAPVDKPITERGSRKPPSTHMIHVVKLTLCIKVLTTLRLNSQ